VRPAALALREPSVHWGCMPLSLLAQIRSDLTIHRFAMVIDKVRNSPRHLTLAWLLQIHVRVSFCWNICASLWRLSLSWPNDSDGAGAQVPFFNGLRADAVVDICSLLQSYSVMPNHVIIDQGEPYRDLVILTAGVARTKPPDEERALSGERRSAKQMKQGELNLCIEYGPGSFFGELVRSVPPHFLRPPDVCLHNTVCQSMM
jgi:hypothetical protein